MNIKVFSDANELGKEASVLASNYLNKAIEENGSARLVLSTGASQLETLHHLVNMDVDWSKVEMFHLDEYLDLPITHPASFRKYLKTKFIDKVNLKNYYLVNGEDNKEEVIEYLTKKIKEKPIDLALIGIGENAHIAFNDPPADFHTKNSYIVVNLDNDCKNQQKGEGWFESINDVPDQAISMTVHQILQSKAVISVVPHEAKADAIKKTIESDVTNKIPATALKEHKEWHLFLDEDSASKIKV